MTAHKHAEMIKAKADNMELVLFSEHVDGGWVVCGGNLPSNESLNYFLCLPQHNENGQCLHWLNGGLIECNSKLTKGWEGCADYNECFWKFGCGMMREDAEYRIKPRKEKRWIAINVKNGDVCLCTESSAAAPNYQIVEIEVEVQP